MVIFTKQPPDDRRKQKTTGSKERPTRLDYNSWHVGYGLRGAHAPNQMGETTLNFNVLLVAYLLISPKRIEIKLPFN